MEQYTTIGGETKERFSSRIQPVNMDVITEILSRTPEGDKLLGQLKPALKEVETKLDELNDEISTLDKIIQIAEDTKTLNPLSRERFKDFFDYVSTVVWELTQIFENLCGGYPHHTEF